MDIYQAIARPVLFSALNTDPEWAHQQVMQLLGWLDDTHNQFPSCQIQAQMRRLFCLDDPRLHQSLWGLSFPNPVGLAAGFDKDGIAAGVWSEFGFGFAELGTVTCHAQPGNSPPRLFRLLPDRAVLNRMGFNNRGAAVMAERLRQRWREGERGRQGNGEKGRAETRERRAEFPIPHPPSPIPPFPLGINLGKSKVTPLEAAAEDYLTSFRLLKSLGDYFVVNVSSPNTPGLRSLQAVDQLAPILATLQQENQGQKPLLVKIAPDLEWQDIAAILELAQTYGLAGIIATNTTIRRDGLKTRTVSATGNPVTEEAGGISGAPVRQRSTEVIRFIWKETGGTLPIIGVGGVFTAEDAWEKITAGASLVQVYTGWVYEGPWMVRRILQGLMQKLEERGLPNIQAAIGLVE